ncbi:MAG: 50S ribosomal protein L22 [Firmicutes bacterium]|jgi:large subunit ribosomal protein L22|nr:50S ribosomal protein L22 [Bacillota bacterium]
MESKAQARFIRIAPRKARIVIDLIRGKSVNEALGILRYTPKKGARIIEKVLKSAVANAENNNNMSRDALVISKAYVDEGPTLKRYKPRARGRATRIRKRTSHITVMLREREEG